MLTSFRVPINYVVTIVHDMMLFLRQLHLNLHFKVNISRGFKFLKDMVKSKEVLCPPELWSHKNYSKNW